MEKLGGMQKVNWDALAAVPVDILTQQHAGVQDAYGSCPQLLSAIPKTPEISPIVGRDQCTSSQWLIFIWPLSALLLSGL